MIEQKMRSALPLLAGLLLSAGAWGQSVRLEQSVSYQLFVAHEFFGAPDGRTVVIDEDAQAAVNINIVGAGSDPAVGTLDAGNKATLTFTLAGATFAGPVSPNTLKLFRGGTELGSVVRTIEGGGGRGDRSVSFDLDVRATVDLATAGQEFFFFAVPSLVVDPVVLNPTAMPNDRVQGVTVVATISQGSSVSNPFPTQVVGADGAPNAAAGVLVNLENSRLITLQRAVAANLGAGETANVAINNLKAIADGTQVTMADGTTTVRGVTVGALSVTLTPSPNATGSRSSLRVLRSNAKTNDEGTLNSGLGGTARVMVSGPFQAGDRVVLGADQGADGAKAFTMDDGAMMTDVPIGAMAAMPVVYIPGGTADLRPGVFTASLELRFNDPLNASGPVPGATSTGTIAYQGITTRAYAHGVSRANDVEVTSFLRLTCASVTPAAAGCSIFISCTNESGTPYFGDLTTTATVPSGGTGVYSSGDIARALGGGWNEGGGRCDLMSNGALEVQHMIRTSGNALHNNSVVVGGTQTNSVGLFRGTGPHPVGSVTVALGPAAEPGSLYLFTDGRLYGILSVINGIASQQMSSTGLQPGTRFNAPPSSSGGRFQPMDHEPGCAFLGTDGMVTPANCFHPEAPELMDATPLMTGDIIYPSRAVFRPASRMIIASPTVATSTGFVLSR